MWFLEAHIAVRLLIATALWAAASAIARRMGLAAGFNRFLIVLDCAVIAYVSWRLAAFYILYALLTWLLANAAGSAKRGRKLIFLLCCLACAAPFFYTRAREVFAVLPEFLAMVGIAYNCLKAIDAVYYRYYTGESIPLITYMNFMLFFPVITAGPIFRYRDFAREHDSPRAVTGECLTDAFKRLIRGYFKKVVVLALVSSLLTRLAAMTPHFYLSLVICAVSYLLLWLDMSGYADIAIAMSAVVGIAAPENFKHPLRAASFTQFWRNWHVSLTDWIREHIFVVLGNRKLTKYQGAAIGFCTMLVMNLWHGFSIVFLFDGVLNGLILACENLFGLTTVNRRKASRSYYIFRCALTNLIFAFTTVFYTLDAEQLLSVLRGFVSL